MDVGGFAFGLVHGLSWSKLSIPLDGSIRLVLLIAEGNEGASMAGVPIPPPAPVAGPPAHTITEESSPSPDIVKIGIELEGVGTYKTDWKPNWSPGLTY
jgi:hypothetical protein